MHLTIDFETRSTRDLRKTSAWRYAEDPTTQAICMAAKVDDQPASLWIPKWVRDKTGWSHDRVCGVDVISIQDVLKLIEDSETIEAHNAEFERAIWHHVFHKRHGLPDLPLKKMRCSASQAATMALPRPLGQVSSVVEARVKKDDEGHRLMLKMCKPRKPRKAEREADPKWESKTWWHEEAEDLKRLCKYCITDVDAEYETGLHLRPLQPSELTLWHIDQIINKRGVYCDIEAIDVLIKVVEEHKVSLRAELPELTDGKITSTGQVAKLLEILHAEGLTLPDLTKDVVEVAVRRKDITPKARRLLQIRQGTSKTSTDKLHAMKRYRCDDGRMRGTMMFAGASTGRWAGKGIQPHNFPRDCFKPHEVDACIETALGGAEDVEMFYGDPSAAVSRCLRGLLVPAPGNELIGADLSNIEGRVLAWLANEKHVLDAFRAYDAGLGPDIYITEAASIYRVPADSIDAEDDRRQVGKVWTLACGYQGGWRAVKSMADSYGVEPPDHIIAEGDDLLDYDETPLPDEEAKFKAWANPLVKAWRQARPRTVELWTGLEKAAVKAIEEPGTVWGYNGVRFKVETIGKIEYLQMCMPNNRILYYCKPEIRQKKTFWGDVKDTITYMGVHSQSKKWLRMSTYGGKLCENIIQALARDIIAYGIKNLERAKYPVIFHVHDEMTSEVEEGYGSVEEFEQLMCKLPSWAEGLPVAAKGWRGMRYQK